MRAAAAVGRSRAHGAPKLRESVPVASNPFPDKKRGVWLCKYKPDPTGEWVRVNLGKDPRLLSARPPKTPPQSVLDRQREFAEIEYNARHGISAAPARAKGLAGYLESYVDAFAASHKPGSVRQLRRHAARFEAFAREKGVTTVQGVTRGLCRDYLEFRIRSVAHDTLKTEMRYLMPAWTRAVDDGLMTKNPWSRLKVPGKSTRSDPVFWTSEEIGRVAAACAKSWQSDLVLFLANTGMRISTALAMRWGWVDWGRGVVTIPKEEAARHSGVKTAYGFALNRVSRDVLQKRYFAHKGGDDGFVFANPYRGGGEIPYDSAREAVQRAIKRAGVPHGTPHDLRHSYARALERSGAPLSVVQSQLGHSSLATTQRYTSSSADEAARWLEDFGVGEPPTPTPGAGGPSRPPA